MKGFLETKFPWGALWAFIGAGARRQVALEWHNGAGSIMKRNATFETELDAVCYAEAHGAAPRAGTRMPLMYSSVDEWQDEMLRMRPDAFHVGAVYVDGLCGRKWELARQLARAPLVVDIDIDDPDRACCGSLRQCCDVCWESWLMPRAERLFHLLCAVMHFERVLPVFSGRRGLHVWVLDERVWTWTQTQRNRFMDWLCREVSGIDREASGQLDHLCKVPLYPHAETQRITVPMALSSWALFRPSQAPTIDSVSAEQMEAYGAVVMRVLQNIKIPC